MTLRLPWSHALPDYASQFPRYGQNLVGLAHVLGQLASPLRIIDVGADVGDSAMQILAATDARILRVEPDDQWLTFMRANVGHEPRVAIEPVLLATHETRALGATRHNGTTRFVPGRPTVDVRRRTPQELLDRWPAYKRADLVKSDTDGFDVQLVPALARALADVAPSLFFEYDARLALAAGIHDPRVVWGDLDDLSYRHVMVWDNFGGPIALATIDEMRHLAAQNWGKSPTSEYWDVALVHPSRTQVIDAVLLWWDRLVPG